MVFGDDGFASCLLDDLGDLFFGARDDDSAFIGFFGAFPDLEDEGFALDFGEGFLWESARLESRGDDEEGLGGFHGCARACLVCDFSRRGC